MIYLGRHTMADSHYHLKFDGNAAASVDAYLEYRRIVGDDDGGNVFSPEEYERYKKKVIPMRTKNRLFVCWVNSSGMDCKLPGPETECQCTHRLKQHKTDFEVIPSDRPILLPCEAYGCSCSSFTYVPKHGAALSNCSCKHVHGAHADDQPYNCLTPKCKCSGYRSVFNCGCGEPAYEHYMLVETKEERLRRGHPVGRDTVYKGMGGLTGFSSLAEGYRRLDPSGGGPPPDELLGLPISSNDHPFLRSNVESIQAYKKATGATQEEIDADLVEAMSALKKPGESDMDYYERRYQEREKAKRYVARGSKPAIRGNPRAASRSIQDSQLAVAGTSSIQPKKDIKRHVAKKK